MKSRVAIIVVTGHPATGKTTLAHYLANELKFPLVWKDQIKESLLETVGAETDDESRVLSRATWALLYLQVEILLRADVSHIVESNFDPTFADAHWQRLQSDYDFQLIQIRCNTEPKTLLARYQERIADGSRHAGHLDVSQDADFLTAIERPMGWIGVDSTQISFDTTQISLEAYEQLAVSLRKLMKEIG